MKRFLVWGYFGCGSAGDDAGLSVLAEEVRGEAELVVMMRNPSDEFARRYGVKTMCGIEYGSRAEAAGRVFHGFNADERTGVVDRILEVMHECDLLVMGPGDFLNEYTSGMMRGDLAQMCVLQWLADMAGLPTMLYGLSANHVRSRSAVDRLRWLTSRAAVVTFRDQDSRDRCGVGEVLGDPVASMRMLATRYREPGLLAVSVRDLAFRGDDEQYENLIRDVIDLWLMRPDCRVVMIPQFVNADYRDDVKVAKQIAGGVHGVEIVEGERLPWETEELYARAERALVTRLHAAVFCARKGVPFVSIAYAAKVHGFMRSIGGAAMEPCDDAVTVANALVAAKAWPRLKGDAKRYGELALEAAL